METCTHCTRGIPDMESPYVWQGAVVCAQCHRQLTASNPPADNAGIRLNSISAAVGAVAGATAACIIMLLFHTPALPLIPANNKAASRSYPSLTAFAPPKPLLVASYRRFIRRLAVVMKQRDIQHAADGAVSRVTVKLIRWDVVRTASLRYPVQWQAVLQETQILPESRLPLIYHLYTVNVDGGWKLVRASVRARQSVVNHRTFAGQNYFSDCTRGPIRADIAAAQKNNIKSVNPGEPGKR